MQRNGAVSKNRMNKDDRKQVVKEEGIRGAKVTETGKERPKL